MTQIPREKKDVAKFTANALRVEKPPIFRYWDNDHVNDVFVLEAVNSPQQGVKTYATVGLSDHMMMRDGKPFDTRIELVGACGSAFPNFDNLLATLAFNVINSNWFYAPGIICPDIMLMYNLSTTMSDIYLAHPFLWDDRLHSTKLAGKNIAWLLAVPISKNESAFAAENGPQELESLFEQNDIDFYNLNRESVI